MQKDAHNLKFMDLESNFNNLLVKTVQAFWWSFFHFQYAAIIIRFVIIIRELVESLFMQEGSQFWLIQQFLLVGGKPKHAWKLETLYECKMLDFKVF